MDPGPRIAVRGKVRRDDRSGPSSPRRRGSTLSNQACGCDLLLLCNQSKVDGGKPVDALLGGLQAALEQGRWQADPHSEARRLDLLPQSAPLPWDELMHHPTYQAALERLP